MKKLSVAIIILMALSGCEREDRKDPINDGIPPNPPIGLRKYLESDGEIGFEWPSNQQSGISGYKIFKFIGDTINSVDSFYTQSNFFEEYGLEYELAYHYNIKAVDAFDLESKSSAFISFIPKNLYAPFPPSQLSVFGKNFIDSIYFDLRWSPSYDTDILAYEIHRSNSPNFSVSMETIVDTSFLNWFIDKSHLSLLTEYFYKVIAIDKGGLKSRSSFESGDYILDTPKLVYPTDGEILNSFDAFEIITSAKPATYKLFIQTNELFDNIYEKEFSNSQINSNIRITVGGLTLEPYKKYYWRVATYSKNRNEVNSFSDISVFTITP
jgi:hypothetical protein